MINRLHPLTLLCFFLFTIILPPFTGNPSFYLVSVIAGVIMLICTLPPAKALKSLPGYLLLFILISCFNPLFYHDGNTVLFYINGKRITLEALYYGMNSATMVIGVLIWCRLLSHYFTSDKIMYLFGTFSPKTAVIISMILRLVPMYREHIKTYRNTQKLLGIYGEGTLIERIRGEFKIFGGFLSWLLEHSMTTSDSMTARGYGAARRRAFKLFTFKAYDAFLILFIAVTSGFIIYNIISGIFTTEFYPSVYLSPVTIYSVSSEILFTAVALIPVISDIVYRLKCHTTNLSYKNRN